MTAVPLSAHDFDDFDVDDQGDAGTGDHAELAEQLAAELVPGDKVRIYLRGYNGATRMVERALQPGVWTLVKRNRHGDWTVSNRPGCTVDVFVDDVEPVDA